MNLVTRIKLTLTGLALIATMAACGGSASGPAVSQSDDYNPTTVVCNPLDPSVKSAVDEYNSTPGFKYTISVTIPPEYTGLECELNERTRDGGVILAEPYLFLGVKDTSSPGYNQNFFQYALRQ